MTLDELYDSWSQDAKMDKMDPSSAQTIQPLHAKYIKIVSQERLRWKALLERKKKLLLTLEDYYDGKIDGKEINRPPFQRIIGTADKTKRFVEADDDMIKINMEIAKSEEKMLFAKEVVASINQRTWIISNFTNLLKWSQGASL